MSIKTVLKYSPNFNLKKRKTKEIKFLIFHYTGMKSEKAAIEKLTDIQSQVGANCFIKKNGEIINMVPDHYAAWHAGLSSWKKLKYLNKNSIGIEISNPGHQFGYKNFTKNQINSIKKLSLVLIKKYKIKKNNILGHSDIAPDRKKDPGERFPWQYLYKSRIGIWHNLDKKKLFKLRKKKLSSNESRSFMKSLKIIGYQSNNKFTKNKKKILTFAFQRRFRPELVNGINDKECLLIIQNLIKI